MNAPARPLLVLVDDEAAHRLPAVAALSRRFEVVPVSDGEDPLRVVRARRPRIVLVALPRRRPDAGLRLCRTLHTDVRPVERVGILDRSGRACPPDHVLDLWLVDGWLGGPADPDALVAFAEAVLRGERPVHADATARPLDRLLRRFGW